ncbi:MAG: hypothetical protein ACR2OU_19875 [Thermomicrobiales bacterium]
MAITLSPKQQAYVEDLMREGSFASEEIVIDEALRALHEERSAERTLDWNPPNEASHRTGNMARSPVGMTCESESKRDSEETSSTGAW